MVSIGTGIFQSRGSRRSTAMSALALPGREPEAARIIALTLRITLELSMRRLPLFFLLLSTSPFAVAVDEPTFYWGAMVGVSEFSISGEDINPTSFTGRVGYEFGKYLSVEGRLMASGSDNFSDGTSLEVTYLGNVSAKLNLPFGDEKRVNVYGLVGYSTWKWTASLANMTAHDTDNGVSYGVGVDLFADGVNGVNFEIIRYLDSSISGEDYTLDTASIGYVRRF